MSDHQRQLHRRGSGSSWLAALLNRYPPHCCGCLLLRYHPREGPGESFSLPGLLEHSWKVALASQVFLCPLLFSLSSVLRGLHLLLLGGQEEGGADLEGLMGCSGGSLRQIAGDIEFIIKHYGQRDKQEHVRKPEESSGSHQRKMQGGGSEEKNQAFPAEVREFVF